MNYNLIILNLFVSLFLNLKSVNGQKGYKEVPESLMPEKYDVNRTKEQLLVNAYDLTKALPKDYVKDGSIDYTVYLQSGLNQYRNVVFPNFPVLVNDKGLTIRSNANLIFLKNSKVILKRSDKEYYEILRLHGISNVNIFDANIQGDKHDHLGNKGEWGMGIAIRSSDNINIYNAKVIQCWGDGVYIGALLKKGSGKNQFLKPSENIEIHNSFIDDNRRNGISLVSAAGIQINNSVISNTDGTAPKSGIDIEPSDYADSIQISNVTTFNNGSKGIDIMLRHLSKTDNSKVGIIIKNHQDFYSSIGIRIAGYSNQTKAKGFYTIAGQIQITGSNWNQNSYSPLVIEPNQALAPVISFSDIHANLSNGKKISNHEFKSVGQVRKGLISMERTSFK